MKVSDIKTKLVSTELAHELQFKNFDWLEKGHYIIDKDNKLKFAVRPSGFLYTETSTELYLPSIDFVLSWLREKHKIFVEHTSRQKHYRSKHRIFKYSIYRRTVIIKNFNEPYYSYSECMEAAIKDCIEII